MQTGLHDIWEAPPERLDQPTVGMVVQLNDGRSYRIVEVTEYGSVWAALPRPKLGGWSKSRKGWSDLCWKEMMRDYQAVIRD